jgi:hypothetical protein
MSILRRRTTTEVGITIRPVIDEDSAGRRRDIGNHFSDIDTIHIELDSIRKPIKSVFMIFL